MRRFDHIAITLFLCLSLIVNGCSEKMELSDAKKLIRAGNYEMAANQLLSLISQHPQNSEAHYELGLVYDQQKERDKAISELQIAHKLKPKDSQIAFDLARELLVNGNKKLALQQLLSLLKNLKSDSNSEIIRQIAGLTGDAYEVKNLTNSELDDYSPVFSPVEAKIAFASFRGGNADLYQMDLAGVIRARLTYTDDRNESSPSYSSKGEVITFDSSENVNREAGLLIQSSGSISSDAQIRLFDVRGKREIENWKAMPGRNPSFSADGGKIVYEYSKHGNLDIYTVDVNSNKRSKLTNNQVDNSNPAFSPDGKKIIFVSSREGNHEIYLMNVDGSAEKRLTYNQYADYTPSFSPDGKRIVFVSDFSGDMEIFLMDGDGKNRLQLTNNTGVSVQPKFSPNGSRVVFVSDRSDFFDIYLIDLKKPVSKDELMRRLLTMVG